ncbi:hypothetical protein JVU11DRAFT_3771 [Chiua virens]|nr:hypothetical protein JVU11DRAFT_3771 [Chiua virens]
MAAVSISLRRSSRLAHAHSNPTPRRIKSLHPRHQPDPDPDHDSSSSDPENELTPRALRALKRQRLTLDPDAFPFPARPRPRKRRKENIPTPDIPLPTKRPSSTHLTLKRSQSIDGPTASLHPPSPDEPPIDKPELPPSSPSPSTSPEPLTPLTPLTPSPDSSPSFPGHDRPPLPSPSQDSLPSPVSLDIHSEPTRPQHLDSFTPPPPISLDPPLDTLIPFQGLHPQFNPELSVQVPPPSTPPQLQALELQDHFHSFSQPQLYVPPNPVFVRDRDINIWKLACQERVDCLLRRYGVDYIKALVESEARFVTQEIGSSPGTSPSGHVSPSQTKFRLYTPASYTYSSTSWGSSAGTKAFDDDVDDLDTAWPMDDTDWVDADVDMEDEDEDDYEDEEDLGEGDAEREHESNIEAVQGLVIGDTPSVVGDENLATMAVDESTPASKPAVNSEEPAPPRTPSPDPSFRPLTQLPHPYLPPSTTPASLPPLSSLHVPLLSEPPRAFMGRGTPPDRRRLIEWSGSGRLAVNGMGPPLYLSPVPQRHVNTDVGIPMSVDTPIQPPSQSPHTNGEWTSFLFSMLEGDGVGVGTTVGHPPHTSEPTWYELGLGSVASVVPQNALELPLSQHHPHTHGRTSAVEQPVEEGNNSSSTLRFALG